MSFTFSASPNMPYSFLRNSSKHWPRFPQMSPFALPGMPFGLPAQLVPSTPFQNKVGLYNPGTGQLLELNTEDEMFISTTYNNNGINITISGKRKDVNKAIMRLNSGCTMLPTP